MRLICNLWPRCRHVQWQDEHGARVEPTIGMLPTVEVAVYPWRCKTCAELGHPYYVPRDSHLMDAEIAAEAVLRTAKPGDSFEELFREADMAAFCAAPKDHYYKGLLGGWGPGAGWDSEIPERDMPSTSSSRSPNEDTSSGTLKDNTQTSSPNGEPSKIAISYQPSTIDLNNQLSTNASSKDLTMLSSKKSPQIAASTTSQHREIIDLTSEIEEVPHTVSSGPHVADNPHTSGRNSAYQSGATQRAPDTAYHLYSTMPATPSSDSPASTTIPGAALRSSHAPVAPSTGSGLTATTTGLTLVVNGVTYPRIENGKERWYTQGPGRNNNYSRYSDLAKFDASKGIRVAPKASRAKLEAALRYRTFT